MWVEDLETVIKGWRRRRLSSCERWDLGAARPCLVQRQFVSAACPSRRSFGLCRNVPLYMYACVEMKCVLRQRDEMGDRMGIMLSERCFVGGWVIVGDGRGERTEEGR